MEPVLFQLCRAGRVIFDLTSRRYRLRDLFADPLDADTLFVPDPRLEVAQTLFTDGNVTIKQITPPEENTRPETRLEAQVRDQNEVYNVIVAIDRDGRLRFGTCECRFFKEHLMSRGPCEHILAGRKGLE